MGCCAALSRKWRTLYWFAANALLANINVAANAAKAYLNTGCDLFRIMSILPPAVNFEEMATFEILRQKRRRQRANDVIWPNQNSKPAADDVLTIHAVHIISEFLEANADTVFTTPEARWRAFVQFQVDHLVRATGGGKFHLELTPSQRMALVDLIGEMLRCTYPHTEEFVDCSGPTEISTTPGDLLIVTNAQYQPMKGET